MGIATTLRNRSYSQSMLAQKLKDGAPIGGVFRLDYHAAVVLTDDFRKQQAGGVPQGGFLLAAAGTQTADGFVLDDDELILLRVRGTAPLPNEADLVQTRLAVVRDATETGVGFNQVTDELTRIELQQSAFDCEVIGTFYLAEDNREIKFGADIDSVVSSARYQVFLPSAEVLSWLASYPRPQDDDTIQLGVVRYASTERRARTANLHVAAVDVRVSDFVSRKTAVFGMTRTGKSNTIKTLVTAVYRYSAEHGAPIGQLIFDPQGEYANVNRQDDTGLRKLSDSSDAIRIYKMTPNKSDPLERPLRINFLDPACLSTVWAMVQDQIAVGISSNAQYMAGFRSISMDAPDKNDMSAVNHFERNRLAFYALLHRAGITGMLQRMRVTLSKSLVVEIVGSDELNRGDIAGMDQHVFVSSTAAAERLLSWIRAAVQDQSKGIANGAKLSESWTRDLQQGELSDILKAMEGYAGDAAIKRLRLFHDVSAVGDIGELIWSDMKHGRLVIADLSRGDNAVAKALSERIVTTLLNHARDRFAENDSEIPFQIVVEEAHNLFERGAKEVASDPWVRLAKEAAKYKIGLIYATQEVSSIDQRILSNTSNWLVAHLNSDNETRELSHYYDFKTWADSIRRCEDVGFIRMKTYSGKYIVPVQIAKFDHAMIEEARTDRERRPKLVGKAAQNALFE